MSALGLVKVANVSSKQDACISKFVAHGLCDKSELVGALTSYHCPKMFSKKHFTQNIPF